MPAPDPAELCHTTLGLSYTQALALVAAYALASALWLHAAGQRLLPGAARLVAAAPVVALNLLASKLPCRWADINTSVLLL